MRSPIEDRSAVDHVDQNINAIALGSTYKTQRKAVVNDLFGAQVAEIVIAPPVYIHKTVYSMRNAPQLPLVDIHEAMARAADIYQHDTIAGLSPCMYSRLMHRTTGLPEDVIKDSLVSVANALRNMPSIISAGKPQGARWSWNDVDALTGCSLFSRRGDIFAVLAAGNGPGIHALWPQAVALGYRTLVRPSTREPFTAQRIIYAMVQAGLENYVALIPTDYRGADELVASADLALVYGGQDTIDKYRYNPRVRVQGPGRSKIVIGADVNLDEAASLVATSMTSLGGAACVSTSAVIVEGDTSDFCRRLKLVLQQLSAEALPLVSQSTIDWLGHEFDTSVEAELVSEGYFIRPVVTEVTEPDDPLIQREMPFPCITVAPYDSIRSAPMLSNSLVVTIFSRQSKLLKSIIADASISNIYIGNIPTTWMSHLVPHDAYLSDFLMCNRGVRVSKNWIEAESKGDNL